MQTLGMLPVELLCWLQLSKEGRATRGHTGTPADPSLQTSFPDHRVTVLVGQGQTGNSVSGFLPDT